MTKTVQAILFCFVFLSQVLLISAYYVRRIIRGRRYVLQNFPPSTYPKLYPQPPGYYESRLRNFARLNAPIVVVGLLIIVGILASVFGKWDGGLFDPSRDQHWDTFIVVPFFIVQMFAVVSLEVLFAKHYTAMAKAPPPRVRTTELRRRRLLDFVSPAQLTVAIVTNLAFVAFVLYYRRFGFPWFTAAGNIAGVGFMVLLFSVVVGIAVHGRRPDPYQAQRDRGKAIRVVVQQGVRVCIVVPLMIATQLIIKRFDPDFLEPVIASLFCQGIALALLWPLYSHRVRDIDFDVYREDAHDSTPDASARIPSP